MRHRHRLHRRERKHRNKVIVMSLFGLVLLLSCGYAAFQTQISLTAKGTIKEMSAAKLLKSKLVTSGDGLYEDYTETNRYVYKGNDPDNYIKFNNELWRIISLESDNTLKIIRNETVVNMAFDSTDNDWETATLNTYLNETYYNSLIDTEKIINHIWYIGTISDVNTIDNQLIQEKTATFTANIGLISIIDLTKSNSDTTNCSKFTDLHYDSNYNICKTTMWLYNEQPYWTISPVENYSKFTWCMYDNGPYGCNSITYEYGVRPVVFISADLKLKNQGTKKDPYIIVDN